MVFPQQGIMAIGHPLHRLRQPSIAFPEVCRSVVIQSG